VTDDSMRAPCGLDCARCVIHIAASDPKEAEKLAFEWQHSGHPQARPDWFRCQGCTADPALRWSPDCPIAACCLETKGLTLCSQCDDFPCPQLQQWAAPFDHHRAALATLTKLRAG
jgi:hypothetical protein